jgi:hypothetical protein
MCAKYSKRNKQLRVVLDACALVSGIIFNNTERKITNMIDRKEVKIVVSKELVTEYNVAPWKMIENVFSKSSGKLKQAEKCAYSISKKVADIMCDEDKREIVDVVSSGQFIKADPSDDKLINLAIDGDVSIIVSVNDHLFEDIGDVKTCNGNSIKVLSPFVFVNMVEKGYIY